MSTTNTNNKKSSAAIWSAIITALASIFVAYIGTVSDKKETEPTPVPPIAITNTQNNNVNAPPPPIDSNNLPSIEIKANNQSRVYINNKGKQTIHESK